MAAKTTTFMTIFAKMLRAPAKEWGFDSEAEKLLYLSKQYESWAKLTDERVARATKPASKRPSQGK